MKKYEMPEIKVSVFNAEDIITASSLQPAADTTLEGGTGAKLYMAEPETAGGASEINLVNPFN